MKLSFSGDLFVAAPLQQKISLPNLFRRCDYNFTCLEGPICSKELFPFPKTGPNLRQDEDIRQLITAFSHVTLANNHIMDYGAEGMNQTIDFLNTHNIRYAGCDKYYPNMYKPLLLQNDDVSIAVFCLAEAQYGCCKNGVNLSEGGYAWMLNPIVYKEIQECSTKVDYIIMYLHGGLEGEDYPLLEWQQVYRSFIDYGADLVIANHPHVIQGKEIYKGKTIYYSLGNLFFNNDEFLGSQEGRTSLIVECSIDKSNFDTTEYFAEFDAQSIHDAPSFAKERFERLSNLLLPENEKQYLRAYDEMVLSCWERYYKSYYSFPLYSYPEKTGLVSRCYSHILRHFARKVVCPPVSLNHLYHNITIDTHRFAVARALQILSKTY